MEFIRGTVVDVVKVLVVLMMLLALLLITGICGTQFFKASSIIEWVLWWFGAFFSFLMATVLFICIFVPFHKIKVRKANE